MSLIRFPRRAALALLLAVGASAQAQTTGSAEPVRVAGHEFATATTIANQVVVLNGAGTSNIMSTRASAVGLYLTSKTQQVEQALAMPGAKRITMIALRDLSARDLSNALLDRIRQNAAPGEVEANVMQIAAVGGVFGTRPRMNKGETLTIDWVPATKSTEFRMNGELMGSAIAGDKFYPLMMKVWLGPKVRGATRDALLGTGSSN